MADQSHLDILAQGVAAWNSWRERNRSIGPDLSEAHLTEADLAKAHLSKADLTGAYLSKADLTDTYLHDANLTDAYLSKADLSGAHLARANLYAARLTEAKLSRANLYAARLTEAKLSRANLFRADLTEANLSKANLFRADLTEANLTEANLSDAVLERSTLVETNLEATTLRGCWVYGASAWDVKLAGAEQKDLIVSPKDESIITVDDLEVAQFIYLLLKNEKLRQVIDTITSKVVLILGRFTSERKVVLDALRDSLRQHDYLPVLFDFDKPTSRDLTETVTTLAHMARFIIADITDAKSIPQELQAIVPNLPSVPVQPLLLTTDREYGMFERFRRFPWVLETFCYNDLDEVLASIENKVISPAEAKARELSG